jgi:hypothetical protein
LLIASKLQFDSFRFPVAESTAPTVTSPKQMTQSSLLIASKVQFDSFRFAVAHSTVGTVISIHIHDNGNYSVHYLEVNDLIANCILSFASITCIVVKYVKKIGSKYGVFDVYEKYV